MIYLKIYETEKGRMIAMCDENLIGKVLKQGKMELDLKTYSDFYRGDLISEETALSIVTGDGLYSANIVGKNSVGIFLVKGLVDKNQVKKISKVPFVQLYMV